MGAVAPERCLAIPGMLPEQVPAAMSIFDVAFDPAGMSAWRLGRSQLRWLEAGAWAIPLVGDPRIYPTSRTASRASTRPNRSPSRARSFALWTIRCCGRLSVPRAKRRVEERHTMEAVAPAVDRGRSSRWRHEGRLAGGRVRRRRAAPSSPRRSSGPRRPQASRWSSPAGRARPGSPAATCACIHNCVTYPAAETIAALEGKPVLRYWHDLAREGGAGDPALEPLGGRARDERLHLAAPPRPLPAPGRRASHVDPARDRPRALPRARRKRGRAAPAGSARRCTPGKGLLPGVRVGGGATSPSTSGAPLPFEPPQSPRVASKGPVPPRVRADDPARSTSASSSCRRPPSRSAAPWSRRGRRAAS